MRYKCIGSPDCMKTFEFGHALRAHIASCEAAQKIIKRNDDIKKLEYHVGIEYTGIYGTKVNTFFPAFSSLDQTRRFNFVDRFRFTPLESKYCPTIIESSSAKSTRLTRSLLKPVSSSIMNSTQVQQALQHSE